MMLSSFIMLLSSTIFATLNGYSLEKMKNLKKTDIFATRQDNTLPMKNPLAPTPTPEPFWVTTEVRSIQWKRNCLTTMLCSEPKFTLANAMPKFNEKVTSDWSLSNTLVPMDESHSTTDIQLYTYWIRGRPEDVTIQAYVLGTDPAFRFNRLCDETPNVHIFRKHLFSGLENSETDIDSSQKTDDSAETALELHGSCFNVTLVVRKHVRKCPWCANPDEENKSALSQAYPGKNAMSYSGNDPFAIFNSRAFVVFLIAITALNVVVFTGFVFLCRRRRQMGRKPSKALLTQSSKSRINHEPFPRSQSQRFQRNSAPMPLTLPPPSPTDPTVVDEDYESIQDESFSRPASVQPYLMPKRTNISRSSVGQVQLPTSRRCDHCFMQNLDTALSSRNFPYQTDNCSCQISPNSSAFNSSRESDSGLGCHSDNCE
ncbi:hypothetical protein Ddc_02503 [Ditylenchus destructor]|nr:hypothetical protein Ddc_02503 [Ditylenchus destructor]